MSEYRPTSRCPQCHRPTAARFSREEVEDARRKREGQPVQTLPCTRCGTVYTIRARHVAGATLDENARPAVD